MKLTTKSEYACLALIKLAREYENGYIDIKKVTQEYDIPKKYLEAILLTLKKYGYLKSKRGPKGGYKLAKPPSKINIAEIVRVMDGPIAPVQSVSENFPKSTPIEKSEPLVELFSEIREIVASKLEAVTLKDLI